MQWKNLISFARRTNYDWPLGHLLGYALLCIAAAEYKDINSGSSEMVQPNEKTTFLI